MANKASDARKIRHARPASRSHRQSKVAILALLAGGDRRSIGRANQVAAAVLQSPGTFPQLIKGLWSEDSLVRMRAADAIEKISREQPELLRPYKKELLGLMHEAEQKEMRWHLAVLMPRLPLNVAERALAVAVLKEYLEDRSSIVRTCALQALADFAVESSDLRSEVIDLLRQALRAGSAAMKARSRKLLARLEPRRARD